MNAETRPILLQFVLCTNRMLEAKDRLLEDKRKRWGDPYSQGCIPTRTGAEGKLRRVSVDRLWVRVPRLVVSWGYNKVGQHHVELRYL